MNFNLFKIFRSAYDKNFRHFSMRPLDGQTDFIGSLSLDAKIALALNNPAFLKIIALQCGMFSLGKWYAYKDETEVDASDVLVDFINEPNPFQTGQEFLWEFMFWQMFGVSHIYLDTDDLERLVRNKMYLLRPGSLELPQELKNMSDKIILSSNTLDKLMKEKCVYHYNDGTSFEFDFSKLISIADLGTPMARHSYHTRVDSLLKTIYNNEASMDALNINIRYSGKFMVAGKTDPNDVTRLPLGEDEKKDIESKMLKDNPVEAVKSMIDIKRFVENAGDQKLDAIWLHTYYIIGQAYDIPRDVLEAFNSGTYENQEKARGAHVSYSLQPKGDKLASKLSKALKLKDKGLKLVIDWEHLPFMQVFAEQRARAEYTKTQSLLNLQKAGIQMDEINEFLDTKFTDNGRQKASGEQ